MKILDIFLFFSFLFLSRAEEIIFLSKFFTDVQITSRVLNIGNPSSALADNGLFISVWALHQTNPTESGIFGQMYNKDGSLNGGQVKISTSNYVLDNPSVTFENDGTILVVWTSRDQDGDGSGIYGQYLLLTEKIGSEFLINTYTVGDQKNPSVASSGGYFIVVWHGPDGSENGIFMKIYDGNGIAINEIDYLVNQKYLNDQSYPSIDMLTSSSSSLSIFFVITWMSFGQDANPGYGIYARKFVLTLGESVNLELSDEFMVNQWINPNQTFPKIRMELNGLIQYVITWQANGGAIQARAFLSDNSSSSQFYVNTRYNFDSNFVSLPSVAISKDYGIVFVYQLKAIDSENFDIYAHIYKLNTEPVSEFKVNTYTTGDQKEAFVNINSQGQILITWLSKNLDATGNSLNFQIYLPRVLSYFFSEVNSQSNHDFPFVINKGYKFKIAGVYDVLIWLDQGLNIIVFGKGSNILTSEKINTQNVTYYEISILDSTNYIVVWSNNTNGFSNIYAKSNLAEEILQINQFYEGINPKILGYSNRAFYVAWTCYQDINEREICGRYMPPDSIGKNQIFISVYNQVESPVIKDNVSISNGQNYEIVCIWVAMHSDYTAIEGEFLQYSYEISDFARKSPSPFILYYSTVFSTQPQLSSNFYSLTCVVVWNEISTDLTARKLNGQIFDYNGNKIGKIFKIGNFADLDQITPSVIMTRALIFVAWASYGIDTDGFGIVGQSFDIYGLAISDQMLINSEYSLDQIEPIVDFDQIGVHVFWLNQNGIISSFYFNLMFKALEEVINQNEKNLLGFQKLNNIDSEVDSICSVFSEDEKFAYIGMKNGYVQIYEMDYLLKRKEIFITPNQISSIKKRDQLLYVLSYSSINPLFIIDVLDIYNPVISNFSLNDNCSNMNQLTDNADSFMEISENRLYFAFGSTLCIFNISTNGTSFDFLKQYDLAFTSFGKMLLNNYIFIYRHYNGTLHVLNTENINEIILIDSIKDFGEDITDIYLRSDGKYLFIANSQYLTIFEFKNLTFSFNIRYAFINIYGISLTKDYKILSYIFTNNQEYIIWFLDFSNFLESVITKNSFSFRNSIYSTVFSPKSNYFLVNLQLGINVIKIVFNERTLQTPAASLSYDFTNYNFFQNWWIDISPSKQRIYILNQKENITYFNINDFGPEIYEETLSQNFYIYPLFTEEIGIYEVQNETVFVKQSSVKRKGITDYIVTNDDNYMFVAVYDTNITILSVNITDKQNPIFLDQLNLNYEISPLLCLSNNENKLYLSLDFFGLIIIDISNRSQIQILNTTTIKEVNFKNILDYKNQFLIASNKHKSQIIIFQISEDFTLSKYSSINLEADVMGFEIYENKFLVVLCENGFILLISIVNLLEPLIYNSMYFANIDFEIPSQMKMVISNVSNSVYVPYGRTALNLFSLIPNDIYIDISLNPDSDKMEFVLKCWQINIKPSLSIIRLIDIPSLDSTIKWATVNYEQLSLTINPTSEQDIVNLLQPLKIAYSTKIEQQELSIQEINFLTLAGYIDNDFYIKKYYHPTTGVTTSNKELSANRMNYVLSKHYVEKTMFFSVETFKEKIVSPTIYLNVSSQLSKLNPSDFFLIEESLEFTLSEQTFFNPNGLDMTYSLESEPKPPSWLGFDQTNLRFFGTPSLKDKDQNYTVNITGSNGFQKVSDSFILKIRYFEPVLRIPLQKQFHSNPQIDIEASYMMSLDSFTDPNGGKLTYSCRLDDGELLPGWITFDDENFAFSITTTEDYILEYFTIVCTASNKYLEVSDSFTFRVDPSWKYILTLLSQIFAGILAILGYIKYKSDVYNMFMKKYYEFPPIIVCPNEYFEQEIYFIEDDLSQASLIWDYLQTQPGFLKKIDEKELQSIHFKEIFSNILKNGKDQLTIQFKIKDFDDALVEPFGTLFVVCECFLYHHLLNKSKERIDRYNTMKLSLIKEFSNSWYFEFLSFENEERDHLCQKFPKLKLDENKFNQIMKKIPGLQSYLENEINLAIFYGMIKADALGIPKGKRKYYQRLEYSRGESCFLNLLRINEIRVHRIYGKNEKQPLEVIINKKFPAWLDYKVKNGVLVLFGTPEKYDKGTVNVLLIDDNNFIIRSQNIEVKAKNQLSTKLYLNTIEKPEKEINKNIFDSEHLLKLDIGEDVESKNNIK